MLTDLFLQNIPLLVVVLLACMAIVTLTWHLRRTTLSFRIMAAGWLVSAGLVALSWAVVTPFEAVVAVCDDMALQIGREDEAGLARLVDDTFESDGLDRDALMRLAERMFERVDVTRPTLYGFDCRFPRADRAECTFDAACRVDGTAYGTSHLLTRWRCVFIERAGSWRLAGAEPVPRPPLNLRSLRGIAR